jgi:protein gp37
MTQQHAAEGCVQCQINELVKPRLAGGELRLDQAVSGVAGALADLISLDPRASMRAHLLARLAAELPEAVDDRRRAPARGRPALRRGDGRHGRRRRARLMGDKSAIEWTDATWNPVVGCSVISPGCKRCYAMATAAGLERRFGSEKYGGLTQVVNGHPVWTGEVRLVEEALAQPLRWRRPRRIFVNSMSDLFHEGLSDEAIDRVFAVMALAPQHTFQVLTKRAERMRAYMIDSGRILGRQHKIRAAIADIAGGRDSAGVTETWARVSGSVAAGSWRPLPNVWLGVSVEDRERTSRIAELRATPAIRRFLSIEPLLEDLGYIALSGIDWVIVGGESGPGARPMHPDWVRSLRDQCRDAGVPFFFKQWGEWGPGEFLGSTELVFLWPSGNPSITFAAPGTTEMGRVGKRAAGRRLDGVEHSEFPA